ncbi:chloride channel protein [Thalassotalea agarivorans]|uniref:H+/Cl-antiporter ClcA n=1 Tax=Thalassotalea agarivorans TaxID=349064 RepID=A0A1I0I0Y5_THASX|nr:chloride channel protein [Thalassotalea agarivorans]SET90256.1 H+/Cl-antiporter ClcA [Thalassotalea agarivorans]
MSFDSLKQRLALPQTTWQLCLLAVIVGIASAFLIIAFNLCIEKLQLLYLHRENDYTDIDENIRLLVPIIGVLVILAFARITGYKYMRTGIPFVLHRLKVAHGMIPFRNTLNQFFGSVVALSSGFSVGKEGPAVHLGAACASFIGERFSLPFNSVRTLCACGIAAGISASFNTPVAAVIFVMEVILREYKVYMFIPIMLASIIGAMITQGIHGLNYELSFFKDFSLTVTHYPYLVLLGLCLGVLAFLFNHYLTRLIKMSARLSVTKRLLIAAVLTSALGYIAPHAMSNSLITDFSSASQWPMQLLFTLLLAKLLMTIVAIGLGIPGGVVGPIISIGAIAGLCAAVLLSNYFPSNQITSDFALMGMAGFMAATLNAPLAALMAVTELSHQIDLIVPAMIVITSSCLSAGQFFKNRSLFTMQLDIQGLTYRQTPIESSLQKIGVLAVMQRTFKMIKSEEKEAIIEHFNDENDELIVIKVEEEQTHYQLLSKIDNKLTGTPLYPLSSKVTLAEAYQLTSRHRSGGVLIYQDNVEEFLGIVTFEQIRQYLLQGKLS